MPVEVLQPPPSYRQGYAINSSEAKYPSLWKGIGGAWSMGLGPSGSVLRDQSGHGNNGTLTNMVPADDWIRNEGQWALNFDGSNDHVNVPNIANGPLNVTTGLTICAWANSADADGWVCGKDSLGAIRPYSIRRFTTGGNPVIRFGIDNGSPTFLNGSVVLPDNEWVWIAGTYDGAMMRIYCNGKLDTESSQTGNIRIDSDVFRIGNRGDGHPSLHFAGLIDDVRVYSRALSPNEIKILARERNIAYQPRDLMRGSNIVAAAATGSPYYYQWRRRSA